MIPWVVAVRAAVPSPRPQAWQALQQAVGLAEAGAPRVTLIADAAIPDGVPATISEWLGRDLPPSLDVVVPPRRSRPPLAGIRFRRALGRRRDRSTALLCRDPRVAAREAGRWARVVHEWHVAPDPSDRRHAATLAGADLHVTPAPGIAEDLRRLVPAARIRLVPNACGLDPERARRRRGRPGTGVVALGLHRRGGLDAAFSAWASDPTLPALRVAGRDQGGDRVDAWRARYGGLPGVSFVGPAWGAAREDLLDTARVWLAPYPEDETTRTRLCPLQVADGLGSGLAVVAPNLPSIRALAGDAAPRTLVLYRPDDPRALGAAIHRASALAPAPSSPRPRWVDRAKILIEARP